MTNETVSAVLFCLSATVRLQPERLLRTKQTQNGVARAKPHSTKPRLNLVTVLSLPEMES